MSAYLCSSWKSIVSVCEIVGTPFHFHVLAAVTFCQTGVETDCRLQWQKPSLPFFLSLIIIIIGYLDTCMHIVQTLLHNTNWQSQYKKIIRQLPISKLDNHNNNVTSDSLHTSAVTVSGKREPVNWGDPNVLI